MSGLNRGNRVHHPEHGPGVVVARAGFGRQRVRFDAAPTLPRTVHGRELVLSKAREAADTGAAGREAEFEVESAAEPTSEPVSVVEPEADSTSNTELKGEVAPEPGSPCADPDAGSPLACPRSWQTLEALRLGVVPARGVEDYTIARAQELKSLRELLRAQRGCRVVWGDYGTGKTHLLDVAERLALEQGFATTRTTLDPTENALHHPLRLYQKISASVRTADLIGAGLEAIFERLVDSDAHCHPKGHRASRFFSPYLHVLRHGRAAQITALRDYLRGDRIDSDEVNRILFRLKWTGQRVLRMSDYRTFGRMYTYLVGTIACWCADAGARGLVLLFDEVERVDALCGDDRKYALEVLRHFAAVTIAPEHLAFDPDELYKGGHAVHQQLPLRFREAQPLAAVFALTPLPEVQEQFDSVTENRSYDIWLDDLDRRCVGELVLRVADIYARAYASAGAGLASRATLDSIRAVIAGEIDDGHDSFRTVVQATVLLLDAKRFGVER